jgi:hypothetical protein
MPRNPQAGLEIIEPADAQEGTAQHHQGPAITDDRQAARDGTGLLAHVLPLHSTPRFNPARILTSKNPVDEFLFGT